MKSTPGKIALIYLFAGVCWIVASDIALASLSGEHVTSSPVITGEMIKGLAYVLVTSLLLYFLIRYYFRRLHRSRAAFHDLFEDNPSPMLAFDPDTLKVLAVNNASLYLYGYNKKEFLAMTIDQIKPKEDIPRFLEVVRSGVASFDKTKIQRHLTKDKKLIYVNVLVQDGLLNNGKVRWVLIRDMTEVKENERLLKEALERYDLTMKATKDLIWDWSSNKGLTEIRGQLNELFGYDQSSVDQNWFNSKIHPDDKERIFLGIQAANASLNSIWSDQFRFQCADGSYKYVNVRGYFLYNEDKKPCRSIGTVQVIQKQKEYEQKIERQNKLLKEIAHKVSHDLRGPVASMKGILSLMAESKNIPSGMDQEFQCLIRCADELDDVIHDVMDKANKVYQV
ncbi:MAG: PAS domain S-box protein [Chitinophagaceae bacterium]|jgi:PAS domain S-box-containing protein|nr:MAG: PAS domain S-box protein [Chitinophagaceae bacterium]